MIGCGGAKRLCRTASSASKAPRFSHCSLDFTSRKREGLCLNPTRGRNTPLYTITPIAGSEPRLRLHRELPPTYCRRRLQIAGYVRRTHRVLAVPARGHAGAMFRPGFRLSQSTQPGKKPVCENPTTEEGDILNILGCIQPTTA